MAEKDLTLEDLYRLGIKVRPPKEVSENPVLVPFARALNEKPIRKTLLKPGWEKELEEAKRAEEANKIEEEKRKTELQQIQTEAKLTGGFAPKASQSKPSGNLLQGNNDLLLKELRQLGASESHRAKYPGDTVDTEESAELVPFEFESSAELVAFYNKAINSGRVTLHGWQVEESERICSAKPTSLKPFKYCLCAANGSGKDAFIVAPFAIWFAMCKVRSLTIITSSSGQQLTAQTENYIKSLAEAVNAYHGEDIFRIRQRYIRCIKTGSEIRMFATDEAGKAEGYHPLEPDREFAIIVNEAKSVLPEIFQALGRCTGFNYWLNVSTPGEPNGNFYDSFNFWPNTRKIDFSDCPHQSPSEREEDLRKYGEGSAFYRSKWLALFTTVGGQVVITQEAMEKWKASKTPYRFRWWPKRVGIDISAGGDEMVFTIWQGNKRLCQETWREADTTISTATLITLFIKYEIPKDHEYIFADDGGVGHAVIDNLRRAGWNVTRVLNQSRAKSKKGEFRNRGAEMWFAISRLVQECLIVAPSDDEKLMKQLGQRYYKRAEGQGGVTLQSKAAAKAEGRPSPDRADAMILALHGLTVDDFLEEDKEEKKEEKRVNLGLQPAEIEQNFERLVESGMPLMQSRTGRSRIAGSLSVLVDRLFGQGKQQFEDEDI